ELLEKFLVTDRGRTVRLAVGGVYKHQVDVGAVVQLLAAELAERDHAEAAIARRAMAGDQIAADSLVGALQDRVGEVRQLLGNPPQRSHAENVAQEDAQQEAAPEAGQGERRRFGVRLRSEELAQAGRDLLGRERAMKVARGRDLEKPFRIAKYSFAE